MQRLARRYFTWIGPATLAEFQAFAGVTVKTAKAAAGEPGLTPVENGAEDLLLPDDAPKFREFKPPKEPRYVLTGGLDGIALFRRALHDLVDPVDASHPLFDGGARAGGGPHDLPRHAIFDRGRLVGLWDYDPDAKSIVWAAFIKKSRGLEQAVARTAAYVLDELGDARSFSLDSPKSRLARIEALKQV